jgi:hypothetical protein
MTTANTAHEEEITRLGYVQRDDSGYWYPPLGDWRTPTVRVESATDTTRIYVFDGQLFDYSIVFDRRVPANVVGAALAAVNYALAVTALHEAVKAST